MRIAVIENAKVINIIECGENGVSGIRFPLDQFTYDCGQYEVAIGDDFADGVFSRGSAPLEAQLSAEQKIALLEAQITDLQLALVEIYEGGL